MANLWVTFSTDISGTFTELSGNIIYNLNNLYNFNGNLLDTTSNFIIYELSNNPIQGGVPLQTSNWNQFNLNTNLSPFQSYWLGGINTNLPQIFTNTLQLQTAVNNWTNNPIPVVNIYGLIENWNVENVTSMNSIFLQATSFNGNISNWNVENVTNMNSMFFQATSFNQDISNWDVGNVTNMVNMFNGATNFNQDLNWNVGNVTSMNNMFRNATSFIGNISSWNVGNVRSMIGMFDGATSFNGNISSWNVGNVTSMSSMFNGATSFNQDISNWDVGNVTNMSNMFNEATSFNQDISNWDVGNVTDGNLNEMFGNVTYFINMTDKIYSNGTPFNYFISQRSDPNSVPEGTYPPNIYFL